jgi:hypothetical protein
MGVYLDNITGIIYTVSEDKTFRTIEKGEITNSNIYTLKYCSAQTQSNGFYSLAR